MPVIDQGSHIPLSSLVHRLREQHSDLADGDLLKLVMGSIDVQPARRLEIVSFVIELLQNHTAIGDGLVRLK